MTKDSTASKSAQGMGGCNARPRSVDGDAVHPADPLDLAGRRLANRVFMAPLSGISDVPFRRLARRFGAGLAFSEMVASGQFVAGCDESHLRAMRDGDGLHAVQLAGRDPRWMGEAAKRLADDGVDLIDINMGCPAKKVVGGQSGSALMREPDLALRLIEATVAGAGSVPTTLKMRLGWDHETINAPDIAHRAESAGVRMITVHGRTRAQFYEGRADWNAISAVRRRVSVPLVANGDLVEPDQISGMLKQSGADALMVGRGAQGRPWLAGYLAGRLDAQSLARVSFSDLVREHYAMMLDHYGREHGLRHARKHLGWYLARASETCGAIGESDRLSIMTGRDPAPIDRRLGAILAGLSLADIESGPSSRADLRAPAPRPDPLAAGQSTLSEAA